MKRLITLLIAMIICSATLAGTLGLPKERVALPAVEGEHLVCIWNDSESAWEGSFQSYDHAGVYEFQVPSWGTWYWIGLWDVSEQEYVSGKWVGHFQTD